MMKKIGIIAAAMTVALTTATAYAKVSDEDAAKLGKQLTPLGGEVAANADGSIPAWTGGLTKAPAGYTEGGFHPDPYTGESPEFVITGQNYKQYSDGLSEGLIKLFETYPETFKLPVYKLIVQHQTRSLCMTQQNRMPPGRHYSMTETVYQVQQSVSHSQSRKMDWKQSGTTLPDIVVRRFSVMAARLQLRPEGITMLSVLMSNC